MADTQQKVTAAQFSCAACGRRYAWKEALAGKNVKCKCGHAFPVPARAAGAAPPTPAVGLGGDDDDMAGLYALAAEEKKAKPSASANEIRCPACAGALPAGSVFCVHCGIDFRAGGAKAGAAKAPALPSAAPTRAAASGAMAWPAMRRSGVSAEVATRAQDDPLYEGGKARSLYLPLGICLVGLLVTIWSGISRAESHGLAASHVLIAGLILLVFNVAITFGAMLLATKFYDMGFGAVGPAILKICALALGPGSVGLLIEGYLPAGGMDIFIGLMVSIALNIALFKLLFDLDLGEILQLAGLIYVAQRWGSLLLAFAVINLVLGGAGSEKAAAILGAGMVAAAAEDEEKIDPREMAAALDDEAGSALGSGSAMVAASWLQESPSRHFSGRDNAASLALLTQLQQMGAKNTYVLSAYDEEADMLILELPPATDSFGRNKLHVWKGSLPSYKGLKGLKQKEELTDFGQKYLTVTLSAPTADSPEYDDASEGGDKEEEW